MKFSLNNVRLRDKMLILYFFSVFAPIVLTNVIFYHVTISHVEKQRLQDITRAVEQIKNEFASVAADAATVSSVFYTDYLLNDILEANYEKPAEYVEAYDSYLRRILNSYTPIYHSVQAITIYVDNPTILYSGGVNPITEEVRKADWYRIVTQNERSHPVLIHTKPKDGGIGTFSFVREMDYFLQQNDRHKIVKIDLRTTEIERIFSNLNLQGHLYLLNDRREIEFTTNPDIDWRNHSVFYDAVDLKKGTLEYMTTYSGEYFLRGWSIVSTIPKSSVSMEVQKSRNFIIWLACINIVIPTLIIIWVTRSLNVRLIHILKHMKKVKNQKFDTIKHAFHRDEIGQLTVEFNRMTRKIKSLIQDVYESEIQKKNLELQRRRAQLNALQSQINPHFLFNTLETIRMRSLMKKENETARIIHNLAKIFRNSLAWSKDLITVREEMELIRCFLEIQKYRFGDKLDYRIEVEPAAHECRVPKMIFLPFAENASIHGIEPLKGGGMITVRIQRETDALIFTIHDNGIGMSEAMIKRLYGYLEGNEEMGDRIGIQNVIYRLKMYYENRFDFRIESKEGEGTFVTITVPIKDKFVH